MAGAKAALVATDPPYLVDYTGERPNDSGKDWTDRYRDIDIKDADGFFRAVFANVLAVLGRKARSTAGTRTSAAATSRGSGASSASLPTSRSSGSSRRRCSGTSSITSSTSPASWAGGRATSRTTTRARAHERLDRRLGRQGAGVGNEHPTEKPVELFVRPIKKHTQPGDVVFEPFSGSGSQLIAAERTARRCRAIEISPPFVDVAIRRWQKATGHEATLEADGRTFSAVGRARLED